MRRLETGASVGSCVLLHVSGLTPFKQFECKSFGTSVILGPSHSIVRMYKGYKMIVEVPEETRPNGLKLFLFRFLGGSKVNLVADVAVSQAFSNTYRMCSYMGIAV
jgi:hypothetical protein